MANHWETKMPQCIVRYWEHVGGLALHLGDQPRLTSDQIKKLGELTCPIIARACSTSGGPQFTAKDVEWIPTPYHPASLNVPNFSIELRTIGFAERKAKLNEAGTRALRAEIVVVPGMPKVDPEALLLWPQWQDKDGWHV